MKNSYEYTKDLIKSDEENIKNSILYFEKLLKNSDYDLINKPIRLSEHMLETTNDKTYELGFIKQFKLPSLSNQFFIGFVTGYSFHEEYGTYLIEYRDINGKIDSIHPKNIEIIKGEEIC